MGGCPSASECQSHKFVTYINYSWASGIIGGNTFAFKWEERNEISEFDS